MTRRYVYGALAFIVVVPVVFTSLIALQRMLGVISYAP
jgi:DMSO/TMAO reductase YedYZ heme-binding membrane subunit